MLRPKLRRTLASDDALISSAGDDDALISMTGDDMALVPYREPGAGPRISAFLPPAELFVEANAAQAQAAMAHIEPDQWWLSDKMENGLGVMTLVLRQSGGPVACATLGMNPSSEVQTLLKTHKTNALDEALQTVMLARPLEEKDLKQVEARALVDETSWRALGPCLQAGWFAWHVKLPAGSIRAALKRQHVTTEAIGVATNTKRQHVAWLALAASIYRSLDPSTFSSMVRRCLYWIPNALPNPEDYEEDEVVEEVQQQPSSSWASSSSTAPSGSQSSWGERREAEEQRRLARGALAQWDSQWAPARSLQPAPPIRPPSLEDLTRHYGQDLPVEVRAAALTHAWRNTANAGELFLADEQRRLARGAAPEPARPVAPVPKWPAGSSSVQRWDEEGAELWGLRAFIAEDEDVDKEPDEKEQGFKGYRP